MYVNDSNVIATYINMIFAVVPMNIDRTSLPTTNTTDTYKPMILKK